MTIAARMHLSSAGLVTLGCLSISACGAYATPVDSPLRQGTTNSEEQDLRPAETQGSSDAERQESTEAGQQGATGTESPGSAGTEQQDLTGPIDSGSTLEATGTVPLEEREFIGVVVLLQSFLDIEEGQPARSFIVGTAAFAEGLASSLEEADASTANNQNSDCSVETVGACTLEVCALEEGDGFQGSIGGDDTEDQDETTQSVDGLVAANGEFLSAGELTFTGLDEVLQPLFNEESGTYTSLDQGAPLWTTSKEITAIASGSDEIPEFDVSLGTPDVVSVTVPAVVRAEALNIAWLNGGEGQVSVSFGGQDTNASQDIFVTCTASSADGELTVPASFVDTLPKAGIVSVRTTVETLNQINENLTIRFIAANSYPAGSFAFPDED